MKKIEILAPAGDMERLKAAIYFGADAVYFAGKRFGLRAFSTNFQEDEMEQAITYAHEHNVKCYITVNILAHDNDFDGLKEYLEYLDQIGVDGVIVADMGIAHFVKEYTNLQLHVSTQANITNSESAKMWVKLGAKRLVLARELSLEEVRNIKKAVGDDIDIECFCHGAMCISYSGRCLLSNYFTKRDSNRGACAQPCRWQYSITAKALNGEQYPIEEDEKGTYILNSKDMCLINHLKELVDAGITSFKIEGRMKSADYVYAVVSTYRRLLDENRDATGEEIGRMKEVFSRSGFTDGYFTGRISNEMLGTRTKENMQESEKIRLTRIALPTARSPYELHRVLPLTEEPYRILKNPPPPKKKRSARFYRVSSIPENAQRELSEIYLPLDIFDGKKANGVLFPPVIPDLELPLAKEKLQKARAAGAIHALIGNIGQIALAKELGFRLHGDYRLNVTNSSAAAFYENIFEDLILSPELILPQVRDIGGEKSFIVYGRLPLMTLEKPLGTDFLRDRRNAVFPVLQEGKRSLVFNSLPIYMGDRMKLLKEAGIYNEHYIFSTEGPKECETVLNYYQKGLPTKREVRRIK